MESVLIQNCSEQYLIATTHTTTHTTTAGRVLAGELPAPWLVFGSFGGRFGCPEGGFLGTLGAAFFAPSTTGGASSSSWNAQNRVNDQPAKTNGRHDTEADTPSGPAMPHKLGDVRRRRPSSTCRQVGQREESSVGMKNRLESPRFRHIYRAVRSESASDVAGELPKPHDARWPPRGWEARCRHITPYFSPPNPPFAMRQFFGRCP